MAAQTSTSLVFRGVEYRATCHAEICISDIALTFLWCYLSHVMAWKFKFPYFELLRQTVILKDMILKLSLETLNFRAKMCDNIFFVFCFSSESFEVLNFRAKFCFEGFLMLDCFRRFYEIHNEIEVRLTEILLGHNWSSGMSSSAPECGAWQGSCCCCRLSGLRRYWCDWQGRCCSFLGSQILC